MFICQLTGDSYINVPADRMELKDNLVLAYSGQDLVAIADVSCVLYARIQ